MLNVNETITSIKPCLALKSGAAAAAQQPAADQTAPADGSTVAPADPAAQTTDGTVAQ